jgi:alkylhydroperoxidase/carboxymuconolactone decarboxylase family protein YurZ
MTEVGFDTSLDWTSDSFTPEEAEALIRWYREEHGDGDLQLTRFIPFLIEHRPGAVKRYRRHVQAIFDGGVLPQLAIPMLYLYYYSVTCNADGLLYETIACRRWGATKGEVLDVIELAFVEAGAAVGNAAAKCDDYLRAWADDEPRAVADPWPASWVDPATTTVSPTTADGAYAKLLGEHAPYAVATLDDRTNAVFATLNLPRRFPPLMELNAAAIRGWSETVRAATLTALACGATEKEIAATLAWSAIAGETSTLDQAAEVVAEILARP